MRLLALLLLCLPACTTIKENGQTVFYSSSNLAGVHFRTAHGTQFDAATVDNAVVHTAIGNMVSKGILSGGTAFATSGLGNVIK